MRSQAVGSNSDLWTDLIHTAPTAQPAPGDQGGSFLSRRQTHRLLPSSGKHPCNRVTGRGAGHCPPLTPSYEPPSSDLTSQSFRLPSRCPVEPPPVWENCQEGSAQRRASIMLNNGLITLLACLAGAPGVACTCGHSR